MREIHSDLPIATDDANRYSWLQFIAPERKKEAEEAIALINRLPISNDLLQMFWASVRKKFSECPPAASTIAFISQYFLATRSPQGLAVLFERDPASLQMLIQGFMLGELSSTTLLNDPESFELLRITGGQCVDASSIFDDLNNEAKVITDDHAFVRLLHRVKNRETVRIIYGNQLRQVSVEQSLQQLAVLARAILNQIDSFVCKRLLQRYGQPMHPSGRPARHFVLAFDGLGANRNTIDEQLRLSILVETSGRTESARLIANTEFYERYAQEFLELLASSEAASSESANHPPPRPSSPQLYRLEPLLSPRSTLPSGVMDIQQAFQHYDITGRTWERQVYVGCEVVAGDIASGKAFLQSLQPWIYRRYISDPDVAGLDALQRKLKRKILGASSHRSDPLDPKSAREEIETMIRFLQLLHGHQQIAVRTADYVESMNKLHEAQVLRSSECEALLDCYQKCSQAEFDKQVTASVAFHTSEHYSTTGELSDLPLAARTQRSQFRAELGEAIELGRVLVRQRLDESFPDTYPPSEVCDLILDPQPSVEWIDHVLARFGFADSQRAFASIIEMSREQGQILSTRKCRYYLSRIAEGLLDAISKTPDPDLTVSNLARVTEELGGKGVLWELFSMNRPTMHWMVRLCATSKYLIDLLTRSPGMIDELMHSLLLDRMPEREEFTKQLNELCRGSEDIDRTIRDFKSASHLQIGIRDLLSKESISQTHETLAVVAEVALQKVFDSEYEMLTKRFGTPTFTTNVAVSVTSESSSTAGDTKALSTQANICRSCVLALGKLGANEPNYHSDLQLIIIFEEDGSTTHKGLSIGQRVSNSVTSNRHFFEELSQRVMRRVNRMVGGTRLFDLDVRFGYLGQSGLLATTLQQLFQSIDSDEHSIHLRQSLLQARSIFGVEGFQADVEREVRNFISRHNLSENDQQQILAQRASLEKSATTDNIKRGFGGTLDVEYLVQLLQLRNTKVNQDLIEQNTLNALNKLEKAELITSRDGESLRSGYDFLRTVESALRLMNVEARHNLPSQIDQLERLAYMIGIESSERLVAQVGYCRNRIREIYTRLSAFD